MILVLLSKMEPDIGSRKAGGQDIKVSPPCTGFGVQSLYSSRERERRNNNITPGLNLGNRYSVSVYRSITIYYLELYWFICRTSNKFITIS